MDFDKIVELIQVVSASALTEFEFEGSGMKLSMQKASKGSNVIDFEPEEIKGHIKSEVSQNAVQVKSTEESQDKGQCIKSPLVGTFYTAPSEGSLNYVSVGDNVKKGQVLAIVEAMKLMNEIESDIDGTIAEVLVENGESVEYGQPLFRIV